MSPSSTLIRVVVLSACLGASAAVLAKVTESEQVPPRTPLAQLPMRFADFSGGSADDLEQEVLDVLGVDDYINRVYRAQSPQVPIGLYIGYYTSQREGDAIHSPMNCLPGAGWQPMAGGPTTVTIDGVARDVNRYVIQKGDERMLVYYWYQSHGRTVASEYWGKIYMVLDAMRINRTDAALVRVIIPIARGAADAERVADDIGLKFVRGMFPLLNNHIPA